MDDLIEKIDPELKYALSLLKEGSLFRLKFILKSEKMSGTMSGSTSLDGSLSLSSSCSLSTSSLGGSSLSLSTSLSGSSLSTSLPIKDQSQKSNKDLDSRFVAHITFPDNSTLPVNTIFTKTWRLRNSGTCLSGLRSHSEKGKNLGPLAHV